MANVPAPSRSSSAQARLFATQGTWGVAATLADTPAPAGWQRQVAWPRSWEQLVVATALDRESRELPSLDHAVPDREGRGA